MKKQEIEAIKRIDEALENGVIEGYTLSDEARKLLIATKGMINRGFTVDLILTMFEAIDAGITPDEISNIVECKRNGMTEQETVTYIQNRIREQVL